MPISSTLKFTLSIVPVAMLALSTGCDGDDLHASPDALNDAPASNMSRERQDQALMSSVVDGNPDLWAPGSCAGACGGIAPDRTCWCEPSCMRYGDCCDDYQRECLADGGSDGGSSQPKKMKRQIRILDVQVSGDGCGRDPSTGRPNHETHIGNFNEDFGYENNRFTTVFKNDVFSVSSPEGTSRKSCTITAMVKWTPGNRITVHQSGLSGEVWLNGTLDGTGEFTMRPNAGSGPGQVYEQVYTTPFAAGFGGATVVPSETWSNCSGIGYVRYEINASLRTQGGSATGMLKSVTSAIQFPEPGQAPDC